MSERLNVDWFVGDRIGVIRGGNPLESAEVLKELEWQCCSQVVTVRPWVITMAWRAPGCSLRNIMVRATSASAVSQWDLSRFNELCVYEIAHGRKLPVWFEDPRVEEIVRESVRVFFGDATAHLDAFATRAMASQTDRCAAVQWPVDRVCGCQYCEEGLCKGDIICHATTLESAEEIVRSGRVLSACEARGVSGEDLAADARNAAGDPPDYFEYVMLGAGNCTAVDKLVLERVIGRVPGWEEFSDIFQPAVRFYFRSADLRVHSGFTWDGIHEKIRGSLNLDPWLVAMVVPGGLAGAEGLLEISRRLLPPEKLIDIPFRGQRYRDWAHDAYQQAVFRAGVPPGQ